MPDRDNIHAALYRISQNQAAIGCAIAELASWAESCGQPELAARVRARLGTLISNADTITQSITDLSKPASRAKPK
ncbi:hypothetical protein NG726_22655 [Pseudomonas sp. MOB-449]|nr:hypothetical protein [Pseudomonas sp. MOB-449]